MHKTLVALVLLIVSSSTLDIRMRLNGNVVPTGNGHTLPSTCVERSSVSITANPTHVLFPSTTTVSWVVGLPDDCPSLNVQLNSLAVEPAGSRTFAPGRTTDYVVVVSETSGNSSATKSANIQVTLDGYPNVVKIDTTTQDPVGALIGALTESKNLRQVVELCGDTLELNLGDMRNILVHSFRTLRAAAGCERSLRRLGPLMFSHFKVAGPLFVINGDHIDFSGFRLEGPESGVGTDDNNGSTGIRIVPLGCEPAGHDCVLPGLEHVEVSNMEIFHWDIAGVDVRDAHAPSSALGRLWNTNVGVVHVANNFIHDNRQNHIGYGVVVGDGAYALIERNVFNQNRHAIAGSSKDDTGRDFSGYTARDNLILSGGGLHCSGPFCWHTHIIDMHGDESQWTQDHNCGNAGETIMIERNTVLYTNGEAIKIRGNPVDKAVVDNNVFAHGSVSEAIAQNGKCSWFGDDITNPIKVTPTNVFGVDPTADLRSCNFAGDDGLDQFMATGVTWWAKSATTGQWRYLNTMPEKVPQLLFRDIDGDGICDVLPWMRFPDRMPDRYSKGGATPWLPVVVIQPTH
jgi:hypothetical protein